MMTNDIQKNIVKQRVLYTLCFFALCVIDWAKTSLDGRTQMTATNITGIVVAIIIISNFSVNGWVNKASALWALICVVLTPIGLLFAAKIIPYRGQIISAAANIIIYGFIIIRIARGILRDRKKVDINLPIFFIWLIMLMFMLFSVNEHIWPIWYAFVFGSFYLTDFSSGKETLFLDSLLDGIIIGFFVIQGMAFVFRPYDISRYHGFYINPNLNALFYLMVYVALLSKLLFLHKNHKSRILRFLVLALAGSIYGFCLFTGSKTSLLAMILVTFPFAFMIIKYSKHYVYTFVGYWIALGLIGFVSIPVIYLAIRYLPTVHLHPLYFEGEYEEWKVQPGDPRDSEKYVTFEYAMEVNAGRIFYIFPTSLDIWGIKLPLRVRAEEYYESLEDEYLFTDEELSSGVDPIVLRYRIQKYYFERLNLIGHHNDYQGAPIDYSYSAPHAHNIFIQMAFLYGIPAGVMFILVVGICFLKSFRFARLGDDYKALIITGYIMAFVIFGFFEIDWMCGQLPFSLFFILFRNVVRD